MLYHLSSLLCLFLVFSEVQSLVFGPLNQFIRHYETLNYDRDAIVAQHRRARRSTSQPVRLQFNAHGKNFDFHMHPDTSIFTKDVEFVTETGEPIAFDPQRVYRGNHRDGSNTIIYGIMLEDGIFDGAIKTDSERYFIEPASRHKLVPRGFHSVIYKGSDVVFANRTNFEAREALLKQMSEMNKLPEDEIKRRESRLRRSQRYRRSASNLDDTVIECQIQIVADQKLYQHLGNSEVTALNLLVHHVQEANSIYPNTDFDSTPGADKIKIAIRRAAVWKTVPENVDPEFSKEFLGVDKFLDLWSLKNHDLYCLSYLFTYRDFNDGVLGLAFVGSTSSSTAGGICEKNTQFSNGKRKSLNTGVVSFLNYGQDVPQPVSRITFAHELGHNFGSPHDVTPDCAPGGNNGNFIMYFRATTGREFNNDKFSTCSRSSIGAVIAAKGQGTGGCFLESTGILCGNAIIEGDEECDCGDASDCNDPCCIPADAGKSISCKLNTTANAKCSPQQGPCCTEQCKFAPAANRIECQEKDECRSSAICNGISVKCPESNDTQARNGHTCKDGDNVCENGTCSGSICSLLEPGHGQCECSSSKQSCHVCCLMSKDNCVSSQDIESLGNKTVFVTPGTACDGNLGYCDYFNECRHVDLDGPIARLKNLLFSSGSIETAKEWLSEYWYAAVLICLGVILFMTFFIWLCSKKTPRSYPKRDKGKGGKRRKGDEKTSNM